MEFPDKFTDFTDKSQHEVLFEQICLATFRDNSSHPVFPNVRSIEVSAEGYNYVGEDALEISPNVIKAIRKYFPNFEYDFVVDVSEIDFLWPKTF